MKRFALGMICLMALATSGCAGFVSAPVVPPLGWVYTQVHAPLDVDYMNTDLGSKKGSAETMNILGLIAMGDASIGKAAMNGNIKTVKHADYEMFNILGVYSRFTTHVHGD
ncbi:MAG: TRL-like family protein [Planctomycetota bacterium]